MTTEKTRKTEGGEEEQAAERLSQIAAYGHQLTEFLDGVGARVEAYKFSVEKQGEALVIDVAIKASFHPKGRSDPSE